MCLFGFVDFCCLVIVCLLVCERICLLYYVLLGSASLVCLLCWLFGVGCLLFSFVV